MTAIFAATDIDLETDVWCEMEDGVRLAADIYRPRTPGTYPVLLMRTPYDKTLAQSDVGYAHPSWYARHGYVVVIQDCRGRGRSEGEFFYDRSEAQDGFTTIEWAARLPGSSGQVGMYGFSYVGYVQLLAATLRPPSLRTIAPGFIYGRMFDVIYNGGAFALGITATAATGHALEIARRDGNDDAFEALREGINETAASYWTLPLNDYPPLRAATKSFFAEWLDHPTYDEYWRPYSVSDDYSRIAVPALHVTGWYDVCLRGTIRNFLGLKSAAGDPAARSAQKLVIGPWHHMPWTNLESRTGGSEATSRVVDDWHIRWFDHFLKGAETDVLSRPVTAHINGEGWVDFDTWPPGSSERTSWYLHSGGRANTAEGDGRLSQLPPDTETPDVYSYDPAFPAPSHGGHSCCWPGIAPMGPQCQCDREESRSVLVYTSDPLDRDLRLIGNVDVTLFASSSAVDTDFAVRLCVVDTAGCSRNLQEGIVRARFRESELEPSPLEPGTVFPYTISLASVGSRVSAGYRLRLQVTSSDFPQWDRNLNTGGPIGKERLAAAIVATQIVFHDATHPSRLTIDTSAV